MNTALDNSGTFDLGTVFGVTEGAPKFQGVVYGSDSEFK